MNGVRRRLVAVALALVPAAVSAHIGSPNVYFTGSAGPYAVRVVIQPPIALPGRAEINVTAEGHGVQRVRVTPVLAGTPADARPRPDLANPVTGVANLYAAELWIMEQGAYAIHVEVDGAHGTGETVVPMNAVNLAPAPMPVWLRYGLALLGSLLIAGMVVITHAVAGEASLPPGAVPTARRQDVARWMGGAAGLLMLALVVSAWTAWQRLDREYRANQLFKPLPIAARVDAVGDTRLLALSRLPDERGGRAWPRLVTDHGKLMHVFLLREPALDVMAHIHPQARGQLFVVALPPLPAGTYRVYADITQEDGLSETLTASVALPDPIAAPATGSSEPPVRPDPDDSWLVASAVTPGAVAQPSAPLADGYRIVWRNPEMVGDATGAELRFEVLDATGAPAPLVPYMGMTGHAAVRRLDGSVFAHLHPVGSISMASQEVLQASLATGNLLPGGSTAGQMDHRHHQMPAAPAANVVSFPYVFPRNGPYRIWVQVKVGETVMTGVFDAVVTAAGTD